MSTFPIPAFLPAPEPDEKLPFEVRKAMWLLVFFNIVIVVGCATQEPR